MAGCPTLGDSKATLGDSKAKNQVRSTHAPSVVRRWSPLARPEPDGAVSEQVEQVEASGPSADGLEQQGDVTMTKRLLVHSRSAGAKVAVALGLTAGVLGLPGPATAPLAGAEVPPIVDAAGGHVTADALPTVQMDGVVWDQEIVGNTVYAVGEFNNARPAGSPPGVNLTPRANILAYDLTTGNLITSFAPTLNRQAKTVTISPDGSRLYVGGDFTMVNGVDRYRIAALNPTTGALISGFDAIVDYRVNVLVATNTTVYAGGGFNFAGAGNSLTRSRLAAFSASSGSVLTWAPSANAEVHAMVMAPGGTKLVVGGSFETIGGQPAYGMGAVDLTTGALLPWAANQVVRNARTSAAILTLSTDGSDVFGAGFTYGRADGNFEGLFSARGDTGAINWLQDCHGDTYSAVPANGYLYLAAHDHYCGNVGGFPQTENWAVNQRHALSFTNQAAGVHRREPWGYHNWEGWPAPSMVNWFPEWEIGTYTGQNQAAWSVAANGQYVIYGGEFLRVNNTPQQGLVRFAVKPIAPSKSGPRLGSDTFPIEVQSTSPGRVRVTFPANWDRDDHTLNYRITRNGVDIRLTAVGSTFWDRPIINYIDSGLVPGQSYNYRVWVTDKDQNTAVSNIVPVTVATSGVMSPYSDVVMKDGARMHWRLGEPVGAAIVQDSVGLENGVVRSPVTFGASGAIIGDPDTAASFSNSTSSSVYSPTRGTAPDTLSVEAWFRTSSTQGGRIIGFSNNPTGLSTGSGYDRLIYLTNDGRVTFGARPRTEGPGPGAASVRRTVESRAGLNNNQWHHVVGTLGSGGLTLYVDGVRVGHRADTTGGMALSGNWRVGADTLSGWPNRPSSDALVGQIDEPAVYQDVLSSSQVASHFVASGRSPGVVPVPGDAYGAAVQGLDPYLFYRLGEPGGLVANDSGIGVRTGDYVGSTTRGQVGVVSGNSAVRFDGSAFVAARNSVYSPGAFSVETWFNTATTTGGKLIGFGNSRTGNSSVSDRHVYMRDDGRLVFGVSGAEVATTQSFNDGVWHHVVASQGAGGMQLWVDGVLVGTNARKVGGSYTGFWRVGGDTTPSGSSSFGFNGLLDEAAVYSRALTEAEVLQHLVLGGGQTANVAPTALFSSSSVDLLASFNGSGSSDPDGTVVSYAWAFGDGTFGTGVSAQRTYVAAGTYTVVLTVTDNVGATGSLSQQVTVTVPVGPPVFASDLFGRSVVNGFGSADVGGAWTVAGTASNFSVSGGRGRIVLPTAAASRSAVLAGVSVADVDTRVQFSLDRDPTGGGVFLSSVARKVGTSEYRLRVRVRPTVTNLELLRVVSGVETTVASVVLPEIYTAGTAISMRFRVTGSGSTQLSGKAWFGAAAEPVGWQVQLADSTVGLQGPGGVGVHAYVASTVTNAPMTWTVDDLSVRGPV